MRRKQWWHNARYFCCWFNQIYGWYVGSDISCNLLIRSCVSYRNHIYCKQKTVFLAILQCMFEQSVSFARTEIDSTPREWTFLSEQIIIVWLMYPYVHAYFCIIFPLFSFSLPRHIRGDSISCSIKRWKDYRWLLRKEESTHLDWLFKIYML